MNQMSFVKTNQKISGIQWSGSQLFDFDALRNISLILCEDVSGFSLFDCFLVVDPLLLLPLFILKANDNNENRMKHKMEMAKTASLLGMYMLTCVGWKEFGEFSPLDM